MMLKKKEECNAEKNVEKEKKKEEKSENSKEIPICFNLNPPNCQQKGYIGKPRNSISISFFAGKKTFQLSVQF